MTSEKMVKVVKLLALTASENDHEALAAMRRANAMLKEAGVTWEKFFGTSVRSTTPPRPQPQPQTPTDFDLAAAAEFLRRAQAQREAEFWRQATQEQSAQHHAYHGQSQAEAAEPSKKKSWFWG